MEPAASRKEVPKRREKCEPRHATYVVSRMAAPAPFPEDTHTGTKTVPGRNRGNTMSQPTHANHTTDESYFDALTRELEAYDDEVIWSSSEES